MSTTGNETLIQDYLRRLDAALAALPRARRRELVAEVAEHIQAGRRDLGDDPAAVRQLLDRVGAPEDIAAAALGEGRDRPPVPRLVDAMVPPLLLLGGLLLGIGWVLGVVLLWASPVWRWPDKLLGTLVIPGGLGGLVVVLGAAVAPAAGGGSSCIQTSGGPPQCVTTGSTTVLPVLSLWVLVILVVAPIAVAVRLETVRRRARVASGA